MAYENLLKKGSIRPFEAAPSQISDRLGLAKRDIETARSLTNADWAYNIAYNAMLQAARALMFAEAYRTAGGEGQHRTVVQFAELALGRTFVEEVRFFEKKGEAEPGGIRHRRHHFRNGSPTGRRIRGKIYRYCRRCT